MTWGNKLIIVFIAFAALMSTLVYKCVKQNFELVSKDYYNDELRYQDKIDGARNANKLTVVQITQTAGEVALQLPKELKGLSSTGQVWFYCPTNEAADRKIALQVNDEGLMTVSKKTLAKTNYKVELTWQTSEDKFYYEQTLSTK